MIRISVYHEDALLTTKEAENEVFDVYKAEWQEGDRIVIEAGEYPAYVSVRLEDTVGEGTVYLTGPMSYEIPFGFMIQGFRFSDTAFKGAMHYLHARLLSEEEQGNYTDLLCNPYDQHDAETVFPHMTANAETRGEPIFHAINVNTGLVANDDHWGYPYGSWGVDKNPEAKITAHFGRPVNVDKLVIYLRADFPHDNWWPEITLSCSDGTVQKLSMKKTGEGQAFELHKKGLTWLSIDNMIRSDEPAEWPALSALKAYGTNA